MNAAGRQLAVWFLALGLCWRVLAIAGLAVALAAAAQAGLGFATSYAGEILALAAALAFAIPTIALNEAARSRKRLGLAIAQERAALRADMTEQEIAAIDAEVGRLVRQHLENRDAALEWSLSSELLLYLGYACVLAASGGKLLLG